MSRDHLTRMDVDTRWMYGDHTRRLQRAHPAEWPIYWAAYQAVLAESWWEAQRVTLEQAWSPVIPCRLEDALAALQDAGLLDRTGRVSINAWRKWFEVVFERLERASAAGRAGAAKRWKKADSKHESAIATGMRSHSDTNATGMPIPAIPSHTKPSPRAPARETIRTNDESRLVGGFTAEERRTMAATASAAVKAPPKPRPPKPPPDDADVIERCRAVLADPGAPAWKRDAARAQLAVLGVPPPPPEPKES